MEDLIGKVLLVVRGESYEAGIERITAHPADSRSPWHQEDRLDVWLTFERGQGKYPGSTLGFGVTLPVKDSTHYYKPDELLRLIKPAAERELEKIQVKHDEDHAHAQAMDKRQGELNVLVSQLTNSLKEIP